MIEPQKFFNDRLELESWLKDKPVEWGQVIATRAALRVFPLIVAEGSVLTLGNFRSNFISWAACNYPQYDMGKVSNYAAVANGLDFDRKLSKVASLVFNATTNATFTFAHTLDIFPFDTRAVYEAISSADQVVPDDNLIWRQSNHDASWLELNTNAQGLIHQPLWLAYEDDTSSELKVQKDIIHQLDQFAHRKTTALKNAHMIVNWYRALLPSEEGQKPYSYFGEKADIAIAMQAKEFWERGKNDAGVEAVLDDIAKIVEENPRDDGSVESSIKKESNKKLIQPAERTDVKPKSDEPTAEDELGRRPFAESLVDKINEVQEAGQKDGFAVHLHAPWGAGKTSILLMMQDYMKRSAKTEAKDKDWVVVNFNAWEHERRKPPWWPLMEAVERDCSAYLSKEAGIRPEGCIWQQKCDAFKSLFKSKFRSPLLRWKLQKDRWYWWKFQVELMPVCLAFFMIGILTFLFFFDNGSNTLFSNILKIFAGVVGAVFTFITATQNIIFGSKDNADYYFQLSNDPLGRIHNLFNKLIDGVNRPVCIYIDDLDRCHADFVVDLLEGIQSSFRHEMVTYVVAADKGWIRSAFETRYDTFKDHVGDPAQPLGYLFLEKIFQMSTPIPGMAAYVKQDYFDNLLGVKASHEILLPSDVDYQERVESAIKSLEEAHPDGITPEKISHHISNDPTPENLAAAVKLVDTSLEAEEQSKHLLSQFAPVLSGSPREMKRLLNAFAMRRALWILQVSTVSMEELFRWTILEQSYPALANVLTDQPDWIKHFQSKPKEGEDMPDNIPSKLKPFVGTAAVYEIVNGFGNTELTSENIRDITKGYGNYS